MPCSKSVTLVGTNPSERYFSQIYFAIGAGPNDGFTGLTGLESGSFSFDVPAYLSVEKIKLTTTQFLRMPMRLENLSATGGNFHLPSSDPSWPHTPCWAGTYQWQWLAGLTSSLSLPDLSTAVSYNETASYTNVVTEYDLTTDFRGASGRSYRNWFQFGQFVVECPIQLNCSVSNSKIPCQNQIIECDGATITRTTNYLVRDNSTGYSGTPAPNIPPVVSSVGGNILTQFPSASTVVFPWSLGWTFTNPTNPGFTVQNTFSSFSPLTNYRMILEFWYTV